jgi:hypothetical protein
MNTLIEPTRILDNIRDLLPWAHGHQIKSIATFVVAIIEKQTALLDPVASGLRTILSPQAASAS